MLQVDNLSVSYRGVQALEGLSLHVAQGQVVTLLGANGAGKSSALAAIAGTVRPSSGRVTLAGQDVTGQPAHRLLVQGLALIPEGGQVFARLSVFENLRLGAYLAPASFEARVAGVYKRFPRLEERRKQLAGTLSGGERSMLAIGRALMSAPRLILVDEPSLGLAPLMIETMFEALAQLGREGVTVLLVEQNVSEALELADYGYVLQSGRLVMQGSAEDLKASPEIRRAYLGL